MNFWSVRKWEGKKKNVRAHTFLSEHALLYAYTHFYVAVVSAAQRELPSIRPSDLPPSADAGEQRGLWQRQQV